MKIIQVITNKLIEMDQPVITDYDLYMTLFNFYHSKSYSKEELEIDSKFISWRQFFNEIVEQIIDIGILITNKDFPKGKVYQIAGKRYIESSDIVCSIDPFAYISHLSAMEYHGLTNRFPKILFISTPPSQDWSKFANLKMKKDCQGAIKDYLRYNLPKLIKLKIYRIQKTQINIYSSIHYGAFKRVEGRKIRVSTIGRTFLDMLRKPDYCGGMSHVIDIFKEYGSQYKKLIIDEIDRHGKSIEKARAGYLLEECCEINDNRIDKWAKNVQRGGSRKLDPENQFSEVYSERWCLSINI